MDRFEIVAANQIDRGGSRAQARRSIANLSLTGPRIVGVRHADRCRSARRNNSSSRRCTAGRSRAIFPNYYVPYAEVACRRCSKGEAARRHLVRRQPETQRRRAVRGAREPNPDGRAIALPCRCMARERGHDRGRRRARQADIVGISRSIRIEAARAPARCRYNCVCLAAGLRCSVSGSSPRRSRGRCRASAHPGPAAGAARPAGADRRRAAYLLLDFASGPGDRRATNADERRDPASLTKLMTAYLVFAALREGKTHGSRRWFRCRTAAWHAEGSRMFIEPRKAVSVDELLHGMIVQSGNDASIALAELVAGQRGRLRRADERRGAAPRAREHALRQRDRSAAIRSTTRPPRDLATLAAAVIRDFPEYYPLYSLKEYPLQQHHAAEPQPAALDRSVRRRHEDRPHRRRRMVPRRLGEARRAPTARGGAGREPPTRRARAKAQKLLNYGFQAFDTVQLYQSGKPVSTLRVWKGAAERRRRRILRRPVPDAAEGQGRQAAADDDRDRAAGRAGAAGASAWAP